MKMWGRNFEDFDYIDCMMFEYKVNTDFEFEIFILKS